VTDEQEEKEENPPIARGSGEASVSYDGSPVGYKKPPAQHQFKKGQKPPGSGRKKGHPNLQTVLERVLGDGITITDTGKKRRVHHIEALLLKARAAAYQGDILAVYRFFALIAKLYPHLRLPEPPIPVIMIPGDEGL
jgi:hypothetical protein